MSQTTLDKVFNLLKKEGITGVTKGANRFIQSYALGCSPISKTHLLKFNTVQNNLVNRLRYDAPPDPYKRITIPANRIQHRIRYKSHNYFPLPNLKFGGLGLIKSGDWDSSKYQEKIDDIWKIKGLEERFKQGHDWKETTYFSQLVDLHHKKRPNKNRDFSNIENKIIRRCENLDDLFSSIQSNGYIAGHSGQNTSGNKSFREPLEILVTIGRDGEIYLWDGHHRFAIARILDIKIPVQIYCRHREWQKTRDSIHNSNIPTDELDALQNHPDLTDVLY